MLVSACSKSRICDSSGYTIRLKNRILPAAFLAVALSSPGWSQKLPVDPTQPSIPAVPGLLEKTLTARKLTDKEKFQFRIIQQCGWAGVVGSAFGGVFYQVSKTPKQWGQGWDAYGARTASLYGTAMSYQVFTYGLEAAFHEDPRYFPSAEKGFARRFYSVLKQSLAVKTDDGHTSFAFARVGGAFGSGFLTNSWQPHGYNGVRDGLVLGSFNLAGQAGLNLVQEFFPFTRNSHFRHHP